MLTLDRVCITQGAFSLTADWKVPQGALVSLIGPSGGGKSTLLGALAGLVSMSGQISWQGAGLNDLPPGQRPMAVLFQDQNLFPHLSAAQNVGLAISQRRLQSDERNRVNAALAHVGLAGLGDRRPAQLSGGQQNRVALARTLLLDRPVWLLDEPFAALGPGLRAKMMALVQQIAGETGATVLFVTHDPADARQFGDTCVLVDGGVAHPPQPTEAMFAAPTAALRAYLGQG